MNGEETDKKEKEYFGDSSNAEEKIEKEIEPPPLGINVVEGVSEKSKLGR